MRILLVTCMYDKNAPSGENIVFEREKLLLEEHNNYVFTYIHENTKLNKYGIIGKVYAGVKFIWSLKSKRDIIKIVSQNEIEVVHFHNVFPTISLSAISSLLERKVEVVMTLHNYRYFCLRGIPLRNGYSCFKCIEENNPIYGLLYKCYRNSFTASFLVYLSIILNKTTKILKRKKIKFIVLTQYQKRMLEKFNLLNKESIFVKPHFLDTNITNKESKRKNQIIFIGRFSEEKGISHLFREWLLAKTEDYKLIMIGGGPMEKYVNKVANEDPSIENLGLLKNTEVINILKESKFSIFSSICYETFGLSLIESLSVGTPVIATDLGSNKEIIEHGQTGYLYDSNIVGSGSRMISRAILEESTYNKMSEECIKSFQKKYSKEANYKILNEIYKR